MKVEGFAPDIMKILENNYTDAVKYGYGVYDFLARDAEDFPTFTDQDGYIYRVWPFENVVRFAPGGLNNMDYSKTIGYFDHLDEDGNMILVNGSFCPQIQDEMSASMVVKCAADKSLDMIETSVCRYHFTVYHPTICTSEPTTVPFLHPSSFPTVAPSPWSKRKWAPTLEPTEMPAYPTEEPTTEPSRGPTGISSWE